MMLLLLVVVQSCSADYNRLNNINALVLGLWPSVSAAIKKDIVMQMVPTMMDQAVKDYGAGYLTDLKLLEFELGKVCEKEIRDASQETCAVCSERCIFSTTAD